VTRQKTLRRKGAFKTGPIWVRFAKKRRELPGKWQSIFVIRHIPPTRQNNTGLRRGGLPGDNPLRLAPQLPGKGPKTRNPPRCTPATFVGPRGPKRGSTSRPVFTSHLPGKITENAEAPRCTPATRQMTPDSHPPEASGPRDRSMASPHISPTRQGHHGRHMGPRPSAHQPAMKAANPPRGPLLHLHLPRHNPATRQTRAQRRSAPPSTPGTSP
jgi:hypothetical protein